MIGVASAGLRMTEFPHASAAAVIPQGIASEKFHGGITATTPRGAITSPCAVHNASAACA